MSSLVLLDHSNANYPTLWLPNQKHRAVEHCRMGLVITCVKQLEALQKVTANKRATTRVNVGRQFGDAPLFPQAFLTIRVYRIRGGRGNKAQGKHSHLANQSVSSHLP